MNEIKDYAKEIIEKRYVVGLQSINPSVQFLIKDLSEAYNQSMELNRCQLLQFFDNNTEIFNKLTLRKAEMARDTEIHPSQKVAILRELKRFESWLLKTSEDNG